MFPVPTVTQLAAFSGRPEASYVSYVNSALLQAALTFTILAELSADDYPGLSPDDQQLAVQGILAMADWIYLRWPYQQVIANPLEGETIGSYTYSKPPPVELRNIQAQELGATTTGIILWDLAIQYLSKRTRASGVFFGQVRVFDHTAMDDLVQLVRRDVDGALILLGPADVEQSDLPAFSVNAQVFPSDPG